MKYLSKPDRNHAHIRDGLRELGFSVADTQKVGGGFPDLVVGRWGLSVLVEVKWPGESLTPSEIRWWSEWTGAGIPEANYIDDVLCWFMDYGTNAEAAQIAKMRDGLLAREWQKYAEMEG